MNDIYNLFYGGLRKTILMIVALAFTIFVPFSEAKVKFNIKVQKDF